MLCLRGAGLCKLALHRQATTAALSGFAYTKAQLPESAPRSRSGLLASPASNDLATERAKCSQQAAASLNAWKCFRRHRRSHSMPTIMLMRALILMWLCNLPMADQRALKLDEVNLCLAVVAKLHSIK